MSASKPPAPLSDADYIRYARMVDARLWPVIDRYLARRGMTREQLMARQLPAPGPAGGRAAGATDPRAAGESEEGRAA